MKSMLVLAVAFGTCGVAHAESAIRAANNQISFGAGYQNLDYKEIDTYGATSDGVLDTEKGNQPAIRFDYILQGDRLGVKDMYFAFSFAYAKGTSRYKGYLQDISTGTLTPYDSETHVSSNDYQIRLGKGFMISEPFQITPYFAYSYHMWERDMSRDPYGYLEVYSHNAYALGVLAQYASSPKLVWSADASAGKIFNARMEVEHVDTFHLRNKPIYSFGLGVDYKMGNNLHISGRYEYTEFRYGESNIVGGFVEPNSTTKLSKFFISAGYGF